MKRSIRDLSASAADLFSYLIVHAPDFPAEDQTTADRECSRLLEELEELKNRAADTPKKQSLLLRMRNLLGITGSSR